MLLDYEMVNINLFQYVEFLGHTPTKIPGSAYQKAHSQHYDVIYAISGGIYFTMLRKIEEVCASDIHDDD